MSISDDMNKAKPFIISKLKTFHLSAPKSVLFLLTITYT